MHAESSPSVMKLPLPHADFLRAFGSALLFSRSYPIGHPALDRAVSQLVAKMEPLFREQEAAGFAVGPAQLFVGDVATDPRHRIFRDLASKLFRRNIGAVRIRRGIPREDLAALIVALAGEPGEVLP
ncbi:MAG: hypothetical protein HOP28_13485, partial [Gemmatimonadales bacterium]|nr:hypothetical protein [Gemmatimonadales bacterium]